MKNEMQWLRKNCPSMAGRSVLITGGNSGIGFAAADHLLSLGAKVMLACRSRERGEAAILRLTETHPSAIVGLYLLDLASFASIDAVVAEVAQRSEKFDILLHCAGVYYPREARTAEGLPTTVGVNFTGTRRLTEGLLPYIKETGRVVFTTSLVDRFGKKGGGERSGKEGYAAYAESKLRLSAYCLEKARQRGEKEPIFVAAHPGITATSLLDPQKTTHSPFFSKLGHRFLYIFTHSKEKAALTAVLACTGKEIKNGDCIGPRGLFGISGYPRVTRFCKNVRRAAENG